MAPRQVLLMRHAEKTGDPRDPNLAPAGVVRARTLATWLPRTFGAPDLLYATARSAHSDRPMQTLAPLATALRRPLNTDYAEQDYGALAADLLQRPANAGKLIVVAWHHGNIPGLARALGARGGYPDPWDPNVFNLILKFDGLGARPTLTEVVEPF